LLDPSSDADTQMTQSPTRVAGRRTFIAAMTALASGGIAALAAIPVLGTLLSPLRKSGKASAEDLVQVAELHELEVGVPKRVEIVSKTVDAWSANEKSVLGAAWLIRKSDDSVSALSTVCPHLGCGVNHEGGAFQCPCHTSAFRLDGSVVSGPSPRAMDPLKVEVRDERVYLRYVRFKQGTPNSEVI